VRARHADYFDVPAAERDRDDWIRYVLTDLRGWRLRTHWLRREKKVSPWSRTGGGKKDKGSALRTSGGP
jgi:hypothetical protein